MEILTFGTRIDDFFTYFVFAEVLDSFVLSTGASSSVVPGAESKEAEWSGFTGGATWGSEAGTPAVDGAVTGAGTEDVGETVFLGVVFVEEEEVATVEGASMVGD